MKKITAGDFTGYSDAGINEAIRNALEKAGNYTHVEVVETRGSQIKGYNRRYQATLAIVNKAQI